MRAALLILVLIGSSVHAQFLRQGTLLKFDANGDYFSGGVKIRGSIYVMPNELNPENAHRILKHAPSGVYFSVGAERGILGATASPKVTHLLQMDLAPDVVFYNQVNVVLLKVARGLDDFLKLRTAPLVDWTARSAQLNENERLLLSPSAHIRYREIEGEARLRLVDPDYFLGSSYLKSPELFAKAHTMAINNQIQVLAGNLSETSALRDMANQLAMRGLRLSVVDLSNAWEEKYIGPDGIHKILEALSPALRPGSLILYTSVGHCIREHFCLWNYHAMRVDMLKRVERLSGDDPTALTDLFSRTARLSSGGLYTELNLLPKLVVGKMRQCSRMLYDGGNRMW